MNHADLIASLAAEANEIDNRIDGLRSVITGTPWVIECCPGWYLVADGDKYRGGSILGGVIQYTPERIDAAVQYVRDNSEGVFDNARKVAFRDALRTERDALIDIAHKLEAVSA
jgi:hypothetical protein